MSYRNLHYCQISWLCYIKRHCVSKLKESVPMKSTSGSYFSQT